MVNGDGISVTITDCDTAASGALVIPETIEGKPVTRIGDQAFKNCSSLTSITLPNSVTSIGDQAFFGCESVTGLTIPGSVTSIGDYAFRFCTSLASITIPEGVTSIGYSAFSYCTSLTSIIIPEGVTSIGDYAFYQCSNLTSVTIPGSVISIGNYAFYNCTRLTSITFMGNAPTLGTSVFGSVDAAATVYVVAGATGFPDPFGGLPMSPLSYVVNGDGISVTITDCDTAASGALVIPETIEGKPVTSIGEEAFYDCSSLTSVIIPGSLTSIGNDAFKNCRSLASITLPDSLTSIGNSAFYECTSLSSVIIPEGVTSIGDQAFWWCRSLTNVTLPNSITNIGNSAFNYCTELGRVHFEGDLPTFGASVFYGADKSYITYSVNPTVVAGRPAFNPSQLAVVTAPMQQQITLLEQRPTLEEVQDGRPGSVVLSVDPAGNSVTLSFTVEESEDLTSWTPVAGPGVSQTLTLPEGKRFYRFAH